jgi:hypothetical protein
MSDSKSLDLTVGQVQGNVDLTNMSGPKNLDFAVNQVQGNVGMTNISDPKNLDITKFKGLMPNPEQSSTI